MKTCLLLSVLLALVGCTAHVGAEGKTIPSNAGQQCQQQCGEIGMKLGAVAIMADNVGCICAAEPEATGAPASSIAAGMVTIMLQAAHAQQQQPADQRRQ